MTDLVFSNVTVRFGHHTAVDDVSLTVPSGQVVGLVGESGSGKSTLAATAVRLVRPTEGRVHADGKVQMVFQDPYSSLDPRMSIGNTIAEAMPRGTDRKAEVARLLELVNLDPGRATALPARLSGGQRQRVALARALAGRPKVIIADEITSALDVSVQGAVLNLVRDLQRQFGLTMLFISHNLAVVRYVSDRVAVMKAGKIVEEGPAAQVLADPRHEYTRELLAAAPRRDTRLEAS
ncbi:peptide/nickel transport system ATP-binding protein [Lentzea waywayandensis]|uniref:Peptide/nickel transport system ATP-binding protein n=1 Tax=Lentzea waywayandensis TaxID=84724 RepID=A0A1I6F852_9PSEU|nr:peptide/nickel transport system ATP-binding protein [Lentzea waywayandensis]